MAGVRAGTQARPGAGVPRRPGAQQCVAWSGRRGRPRYRGPGAPARVRGPGRVAWSWAGGRHAARRAGAPSWARKPGAQAGAEWPIPGLGPAPDSGPGTESSCGSGSRCQRQRWSIQPWAPGLARQHPLDAPPWSCWGWAAVIFRPFWLLGALVGAVLVLGYGTSRTSWTGLARCPPWWRSSGPPDSGGQRSHHRAGLISTKR